MTRPCGRIAATLLFVGFLLLPVAKAQQSMDVAVPAADTDAGRRTAEVMKRSLARDYSVVDGWDAEGKSVKGLTRITWVPPTSQDYADIAQLGERAVPVLAACLTPKAVSDDFVRLLAVKFLGSIGGASTIAPLGEALDAGNWQVTRLYALDILGKMPEVDAIALVRSVSQDNDPLISERAQTILSLSTSSKH